MSSDKIKTHQLFGAIVKVYNDRELFERQINNGDVLPSEEAMEYLEDLKHEVAELWQQIQERIPEVERTPIDLFMEEHNIIKEC